MNDSAQYQAVLSAIRTLMAIAGGAIVARGWASEETVSQAAGAVMVLIPFVWGIADKYASARRARARERVAAATGEVQSTGDTQ